MSNPFHVGQRWISEGEPDLGLGAVESLDARKVKLVFGASGEARLYRIEGAPLRRVAFRVGDTLQDTVGATLKVRAVSERGGLLHYDCGERMLCETELSDALSFSGPRERFFAGRLDPRAAFDLRLSAHAHQYRRLRSEVRGFVGGRIDLLPHQLGIASEVTARLLPRVLLADEVGLGKTIEACLILHRLLLTGRAQRVLILVPEPLVHQWFVELLRRFNLWFAIFDEARCQALEEAHPGSNPFLDDQLVLADLGLFAKDGKRLRQAMDAGWDLLVVDEAHHLGWSPEAASLEYAAVEALGRGTEGLLLLTATPEQLGMAGHFARLRLLDPDRFHDLEAFLREAEGYREVARLAEKLKAAQTLEFAEVAVLARLLGPGKAKGDAEDADARAAWIDALLDQHGTGRVMFRNTRATVPGFPKRRANLHPLPQGDANLKSLAQEWASDGHPESPSFRPNFSKDPRIAWLAELLHSLGSEKVLLICRTRRKAEAIEAALKTRLKVKLALFHEGLTLVQRDRAAAWFAERDGARLLIASEIGSEGRNFQFAHHLVLFDLPQDPALLEQRIGRLDRIGQHAEIQVHVPFVEGVPQELLARWYHEGLDAFTENPQGGRELAERFLPRLNALVQALPESPSRGMEELLEATRSARHELAERLEAGRDRLLEWNSARPERAERILTEIRRQDESRALEHFLLAVLDASFIEVEEVAPRSYQLGSAGVLVESFPGLPSEGLTLTFDRERALAREDVQFLTWDHPLVTGALDRVLGGEQGNSSFARWPDPKASGFYLEAVFLLECVAPPRFHLDRFLPPTPFRVLLDHRGLDLGETLPSDTLRRLLKDGDGQPWMARPELRETLLPRLMKSAHEFAARKAQGAVTQAREAMRQRLDHELARLRDLRKVNPSVRDAEIDALIAQQRALDRHLREARLRLDALRLIHRGPETALGHRPARPGAPRGAAGGRG